MRIASSIVFSLLCSAVLAAPPPLEIDPNTRIQGGADQRGSGAAAGAGMRRDNKMDSEPRLEAPGNNAQRPDKVDPDRDKPFSERKPGERDQAEERKKSQPNP
jgi:hypothetical protein